MRYQGQKSERVETGMSATVAHDALSQKRLLTLLGAGTVMVALFLAAMAVIFSGRSDAPYAILQPIWYTFTAITAAFIIAINIPFFGRWVKGES